MVLKYIKFVLCVGIILVFMVVGTVVATIKDVWIIFKADILGDEQCAALLKLRAETLYRSKWGPPKGKNPQ